MNTSFIEKLTKLVDDLWSLKSIYSTFREKDFYEYKQEHCQRLLSNFLDVALIGITAAFIMRILVLQSTNAILDLILPFIILALISLLYTFNKRSDQLKHYFHLAVIPMVGLLTAKKSITQNKEHFYLNESFASWLIMMMFGGFSSPMQWYSIVAINFVCFAAYITLIFKEYGTQGIGNDFYVHMTTTIIFSACLIRMNEVNLRSSFNLLSQSKIQEQKWQRVLMMLTDGVLLMQHTNNDQGILLINPSLKKLLCPTGAEDVKSPNKPGEIGTPRKTDVSPRTLKSYADIGFRGSALLINSIQPIRSDYNFQKQGDTGGGPTPAGDYSISEQGQTFRNFLLNNSTNENFDKNSQINRYNEKDVGPVFNKLFRYIRFKVYFHKKTDRHSKEVQFLNDFIVKQLDFYKEFVEAGHSERLFLKILNPKKIIELNMVKLDNEGQVLFLFKEVSAYNKFQKAKTTEKFQNILINTVAHNLFTPLNQLIQLNKSMMKSQNLSQTAGKSVKMVAVCLQQLVFTVHNILEMSKIKQNRFRANLKHIKLGEKIAYIFKFFKDDIKFRQIKYDVKIQHLLHNNRISVDDARFGIILYNIISNSVKHTSQGHIKVSAKIIDHPQMIKRLSKYQNDKVQAKTYLKESESNDSSDLSSYSSSSEVVLGSGNNADSLYLQMSVSDTGSGMSEEVRKRCMTLFGNLKFKKDINQGGMGLGLASSYLICKSLKGNLLLLRSHLNQGSKFLFTLPVQIVDETKQQKIDNVQSLNIRLGFPQQMQQSQESELRLQNIVHRRSHSANYEGKESQQFRENEIEIAYQEVLKEDQSFKLKPKNQIKSQQQRRISLIKINEKDQSQNLRDSFVQYINKTSADLKKQNLTKLMGKLDHVQKNPLTQHTDQGFRKYTENLDITPLKQVQNADGTNHSILRDIRTLKYLRQSSQSDPELDILKEVSSRRGQDSGSECMSSTISAGVSKSRIIQIDDIDETDQIDFALKKPIYTFNLAFNHENISSEVVKTPKEYKTNEIILESQIKSRKTPQTPLYSQRMMTYDLDSLPSESVKFSQSGYENPTDSIKSHKDQHRIMITPKVLSSQSVQCIKNDYLLSKKKNETPLDAISQEEETIPSVLLVDDTAFNLMILKKIFQLNHKLTTDHAVSGEEAILLCKQRVANNQEAYRLIIMDINMPGMDGVVTTQKIRAIFDNYVKEKKQKHYLIVAHTALPEEQFGNPNEKGFDGFMQKPIDNNLLKVYLKNVGLS